MREARTTGAVRLEHDSLGEVAVRAEHLWVRSPCDRSSISRSA
jgi:fumarate hydratase class II